ncbi:DUF3500 domain-containing protein [Actibacterium sp. 188UL27-1]|uniref:DUF3500 domain-containing protein n=1 Tax=Actibacterium sp. 188UL27-1 TaxID=2786961 RepID=UPI00195B3929|nr:DUF3500 domain-containing protein [Actibacterium sp. 188UL27-1]
MPRPTRRVVLAGAAATATATAWPRIGRAAGIGTDMCSRAESWLSSLSDTQRAAAMFDFDDPQRLAWTFMYGSQPAPGIRLEQMTAAQKDGALEVLATGLSTEGFQTALNIMLQQDILRDEWSKGSADRNRERFSLMIFGTPTADTPWAWRWEGHHLSLTYTLIGEEVISVTPSSFSSEPNTVPSGPHRGLVVLPDEESLGRALYTDLNAVNKSVALLEERSFGNILTTAGNEGRISAPAGVPLGDLPAVQMDIARRLLDVYTVDHLPGTLAEGQAARIAGEDLTAVRFGWAGPNERDASMYYRLHGETFLIEFATLRNQPEHHHAIRHDLTRNFGAHRL